MRLDKYLQEKFPEYSRNQIINLIKNGNFLINNKRVKPSYVFQEKDRLDYKLPEEKKIVAEAFNLDILYEDDDCFVINKPPGLTVHPGDKKNLSGTLANVLLSKLGKEFNGSIRPGIVHRLDKDTSGLMVIAKNQKACEELIAQFKSRAVKKVYLALVLGKLPSNEGLIEAAIARSSRDRKRMTVVSDGGKVAMSVYKLRSLFRFKDYFLSLIQVEIKSGRTHQIRVHFASIGHPVVGDCLYGSKKMNKYFADKLGIKRQFLHAMELSFKSPETGKMLKIVSKLPEDLSSVIGKLSPYKL